MDRLYHTKNCSLNPLWDVNNRPSNFSIGDLNLDVLTAFVYNAKWMAMSYHDNFFIQARPSDCTLNYKLNLCR